MATNFGQPAPVEPGDRMMILAATDHFGLLSYQVQVWHPDHPDSPESSVVLVDARILDSRVAPAPPACPTEPLTVGELIDLAPFERLACYSAGPITVGPTLVRAAESGFPGDFVLTDSGRLSPAAAFTIAGATTDLVPSTGWVLAIGQFGDPGDGRCPRTDSAILVVCREGFVVSSLLPSPPPTDVIAGAWRALPAAPAALGAFVRVLWTGSALVALGKGSTQPATAARTLASTYDRSRNAWSAAMAAPAAVGGYPALAVAGGLVMALGSSTVNGSAFAGAASGAAAFDPRARRWRRIAPVPFPTDEDAALTSSGEDLALVTTNSDPNPPDGPIRIATYDVARDAWRSIAPPAGIDVVDGRAIMFEGDRLLLVTSRSAVTRLDSLGTDGRWRALRAPPAGMAIASAAWTGSSLLAVGTGSEATGTTLPVVMTRDPGSDSWTLRSIVRDPTLLIGPIAWTGRWAVLGDNGPVAFEPTTSAWRGLAPPPADVTIEGIVGWTGVSLLALDASAPDGTTVVCEFRPDDPELLRAP
jgi:hypothetical protein